MEEEAIQTDQRSTDRKPELKFGFLMVQFFGGERRVTTYQVDKAAQWGLALPAQSTRSKREDHKICKIEVRLHSIVCFCMVKC